MAIKTFTTGEVLTAADTNTYLANSGLVLVKSVVLTSAATSGSEFQSIFTSTYDNYRIVCRTLTASTNGSQPRFNFVYSGTTDQTTQHYFGLTTTSYNGTSSILAGGNLSYIGIGSFCDNIGSSSFTMDVLNIGAGSLNPSVLIQYNDGYNGTWSNGGGLQGVGRDYDGLKFYMNTGNIAMTATIYGYRKA